MFRVEVATMAKPKTLLRKVRKKSLGTPDTVRGSCGTRIFPFLPTTGSVCHRTRGCLQDIPSNKGPPNFPEPNPRPHTL